MKENATQLWLIGMFLVFGQQLRYMAQMNKNISGSTAQT